MVQDFKCEPRTHQFTFEMVMVAYERRFPHCALIPVVEDTEVTKDVWSSDNSQRETKRRARLKVEAPYLIKKVIGVDHVFFIQTSKMDLKNRTMNIEAVNETFSHRAVITERCKYFVHPDFPEWTRFEQNASLEVTNFFGFEAPIEKVAISQYASYNSKAKQLIEKFMEQVLADGITKLDPWSPSDPEYNLKLRNLIANGVQPVEEAEPVAHGSDDDPLKQPGELGSSAHKSPSFVDLRKRDSVNSPHKSPSLIELRKRASSVKPVLESVNSSLKGSKQSQETFEELLKEVLRNNTSTSRTPEIVPQVDRNTQFPFKPCVCDPVVRQEASLDTSWDNFVMALLCTLVVIIALSTMPMFFLFQEYHRR